MGWTKKALIQQAFTEIGLGSAFNVGADAMQDALRRLDSMMATWDGKGIRVGYLLPSSPATSSLDSDSGLPDTANEAVFLNLALKLAPGFGKAPSQDTRLGAKQAYDALLVAAAFPPEQQFKDTLPRGAGNKPWRTGTPFMPEPVDSLDLGGEPLTT